MRTLITIAAVAIASGCAGLLGTPDELRQDGIQMHGASTLPADAFAKCIAVHWQNMIGSAFTSPDPAAQAGEIGIQLRGTDAVVAIFMIRAQGTGSVYAHTWRQSGPADFVRRRVLANCQHSDIKAATR